ncbi:MAG TPA: hypothetical protein VHA82_06930 [Ramlibacter sp.]|uniref:hypothetical protein n=1 Tax=Ramlibacter sp. TaxID=1917967 RepID=UPI002D0B538C|nr:hypothetical protein [Ramlibacter sp.]HVZ43527.1 hypothetical protein [Ramlibacter sp.]
MDLLARIFGKRAAPPSRHHSELGSTHSQSPSMHPQQPKAPDTAATATRRELLKVVLRDTLRRQGIPAEWVAAEVFTATSRSRNDSGLHWRLVLRHWDARLPNHLVALQNALVARALAIDPMAHEWLMGVSWQFALQDESQCPALPHPGSWTSTPREQAVVPQPVPQEAAASGDVIAGPVSVEKHSSDVKADLERLMSELDAQYQNGPQPSFAKTEPSSL